MKLRGLPFQTKAPDIISFFTGFNLFEKSVLLGRNVNDGRPNGFGALLFKSEQDCKRAMKEKQGQNIGHRYIELSAMTYNESCEFRKLQRKISEMPPKDGGGGLKLTGCVTFGNKERALLLRGLPFRVTHEQVQEFFLGYGNI